MRLASNLNEIDGSQLEIAELVRSEGKPSSFNPLCNDTSLECSEILSNSND